MFASGRVRNCARIFVRQLLPFKMIHVCVPHDRVHVHVCGYKNFTCASISGYAPAEKDIIGEGHSAREIRIFRAAHNMFAHDYV